MAHNVNYKVSSKMFTRNAVKQKTINSNRLTFRGGIRL